MILFELLHRIVLIIVAIAIIAHLTGDHGLLIEGVPVIVRAVLVAVCVVVVFWSARITWFLVKNRDVYERNRGATVLLHKARTGRLTSEEAARFQCYRNGGVLTLNGHGQLRLSDQAVDELFQ